MAGAHRRGQCDTCGAATERTTSTRCRKCYLQSVSVVAAPVARGPQTYDEALALYRRYIGQTTPPSAPKKRLKFSDERILEASDFHAPFQDMAALAALMSQEADTLLLGGDLQDHYSISRFLKYESVPIQQELAAAQLILDQASSRFSLVKVCEGNHDTARFEKLLADRLPHEAIDIIRFLSKTGTLSSLQALCSQFKNVEVASHKVGDHAVGWFMQHGDVLVSHAERYSRVPGSALRGVEEWFRDFEQTLGLQSWRVLIQAHTHAMAMFPFGADKMLVEGGCMCQTHGYQLSARIAGRPQRIGWVSLTQRDGVTDMGSIRLHPFRREAVA